MTKEAVDERSDPAKTLAHVLALAAHAPSRFSGLTKEDQLALDAYNALAPEQRAKLDPEECRQADNVTAEVKQAWFGDPGLPFGGVGGSSRP